MARLQLLVTAADFPDSLVIDSAWFPLIPGTVFIFEADGEFLVTEVLNRTKNITFANGTEAFEARVAAAGTRFFSARFARVAPLVGQLVEDTGDYYTQDAFGNVWYVGEDSVEFDPPLDVELTGDRPSGGDPAGSWEAGVNGAQPGIIMFANPLAGVVYHQDYLPGVAEYWAYVVSRGIEAVTVPYGSFGNASDGSNVTAVLKIKEWTPLQGDHELNYYAWGVGPVKECDDDDFCAVLVNVMQAELFHGNATLPDVNATLPDVNDTLPGNATDANASLPEGNVNLTLPEGNFTGVNVTLPDEEGSAEEPGSTRGPYDI
ncbi:hypothetical protein M885DRAFT_573473 [Pelagophyceae sp. CCMP2097]|nr:hypothetical protein M885DRAFT_573473 [Pelagophyceae sp. CCMP2097]